ncbi:hypothetical protein FB107DRAFT_219322 [Schizophyllum commune]
MWQRVGSAEGRPSDGVPGVASRRPSMRGPKDYPVARPRATQTPARTKPWGRTAYGFT